MGYADLNPTDSVCCGVLCCRVLHSSVWSGSTGEEVMQYHGGGAKRRAVEMEEGAFAMRLYLPQCNTEACSVVHSAAICLKSPLPPPPQPMHSILHPHPRTPKTQPPCPHLLTVVCEDEWPSCKWQQHVLPVLQPPNSSRGVQQHNPLLLLQQLLLLLLHASCCSCCPLLQTGIQACCDSGRRSEQF